MWKYNQLWFEVCHCDRVTVEGSHPVLLVTCGNKLHLALMPAASCSGAWTQYSALIATDVKCTACHLCFLFSLYHSVHLHCHSGGIRVPVLPFNAPQVWLWCWCQTWWVSKPEDGCRWLVFHTDVAAHATQWAMFCKPAKGNTLNAGVKLLPHCGHYGETMVCVV